jgi:hypothetical protein
VLPSNALFTADSLPLAVYPISYVNGSTLLFVSTLLPPFFFSWHIFNKVEGALATMLPPFVLKIISFLFFLQEVDQDDDLIEEEEDVSFVKKTVNF